MLVSKKVTKSKTKTSTRRKTIKSKTTSKKTVKKTVAKKKPFGGYAINFTGRKETIEQVFGKKPITPSEMTKKIWAFVKTKKLSTSNS